jgi:late competence protein required for DNA uptake (superfamily II DNA/RNA helicase)
MIGRRTVWREANREEHRYVPRCSRCGYFKSKLHMHWFFTGLYCQACIQDVLYDNCRNMEELP